MEIRVFEDLERAIRQREVGAIVRLMFEGTDQPRPRSGFKTESELWDYKADCPKIGKRGTKEHWGEVAADVLAFYNDKGGVLVFGIRDDLSFVGAKTRLDSKLFNEHIRRYLGDIVWVDYHREFIQHDQRYLGLAVVPPRGPVVGRFREDGPALRGKPVFLRDGAAIREGDSTRILSKLEADDLARRQPVPILGKIYGVDEPLFRILAQDYVHFVDRPDAGKAVESALHDPRTSVASLTGIGGVGKTTLATWAVSRAYDSGEFSFIASMTAKDRELTAAGIRGLTPGLTSFETLLDSVLDVVGFTDIKAENVERKETEVRTLLEKSDGLLYVDNLETVDDSRIIDFLDSLPIGVRAIVTSRRTKVRVSVHPIEIGALSEEEVVRYVRSLSGLPGHDFVLNLKNAECIRIGDACDRIPLAIRWSLSRAKSAAEALVHAETVTSSGTRGEELLEFSFRRVFDSMPPQERSLLQVLSLFQSPIPREALIAGTSLPDFQVMDALDDLAADALVHRLFDPDRNDYSFTLLPITRAFVYSEVCKTSDLEERMRKRMSSWFEALDVKDPDERLVVREIRQGKHPSESALTDLAYAADRRGDPYSAEALYRDALKRNPRSWRAARLFAEFLRHKRGNVAEALAMYEQAGAHAPSRGPDRALIFREWGMLLRQSGDPQATDMAIEKFEISLGETPNDAIAATALAGLLEKKGSYRRVIDLMEPLARQGNRKNKKYALPLLIRAYDQTSEMLKCAEAKRAFDELS